MSELTQTGYKSSVSLVNGFTQAAPANRNAGAQAAGLAKALSSIAPELGKYAKKKNEEKAFLEEQEGTVEGKKAALLANALGLKQAVAAGHIQDTENPWYWKEFEEQRGRLAGQKYGVELKEAYAASEAAGSLNARSFDEFAADFRTKKLAEMGEQTANFESQWLEKVASSEAGLASQHAEGVAQRVKAETIDNTKNEIVGILDIDNSTPQQMKDSIDVLRKRKDFVAMNHLDFRSAVVDAVILKAVETNDERYLKAFDWIDLGGKGSLGNTTEVREMRRKTHVQILSAKSTIDNQRHAKRERARTDQIRAAKREIDDALATDSKHEFNIDELREKYPMFDTMRSHIVDTRKSFRQEDEEETPADSVLIDSTFEANPTPANVRSMFSGDQRIIKNAATFNRYMTLARKIEDAGGKIPPTWKRRFTDMKTTYDAKFRGGRGERNRPAYITAWRTRAWELALTEGFEELPIEQQDQRFNSMEKLLDQQFASQNPEDRERALEGAYYDPLAQ